MYGAVSFNTCTDLYNHDYERIIDQFRRYHCTLSRPSPLAATDLFSITTLPSFRECQQVESDSSQSLGPGFSHSAIMPLRVIQVSVCQSWIPFLAEYYFDVWGHPSLSILLIKEIWVVSSVKQCLAQSCGVISNGCGTKLYL